MISHYGIKHGDEAVTLLCQPSSSPGIVDPEAQDFNCYMPCTYRGWAQHFFSTDIKHVSCDECLDKFSGVEID